MYIGGWISSEIREVSLVWFQVGFFHKSAFIFVFKDIQACLVKAELIYGVCVQGFWCH